MTPLEQKAQELAQKIHLDLIELASMADEEDKILFINIQGDRMCPTGNVGANVVTEFEISIEEV
ncbi:hypothetical protein [Vibrio phage BUCT006]|nr:hypothetical protein [Vibrio phage BUCT006]